MISSLAEKICVPELPKYIMAEAAKVSPFWANVPKEIKGGRGSENWQNNQFSILNSTASINRESMDQPAAKMLSGC